MSFFPGSFLATSPNDASSYHPLFRFLDDFEQHRGNASSQHVQTRQASKTFTPKFDVKELSDSYELHGDLPGIEQKDIEIQFSDIQTITVTGRTERSYNSSTPPVIKDGMTQRAIEGSDETKPLVKGPKATVEDDTDDYPTKVNSRNINDDKNTKIVQSQGPKVPAAKYWVAERSVGEFSRSFTFPVRVDQEAVKASMKNGVLTIVVPKAKKQEARKIKIDSD